MKLNFSKSIRRFRVKSLLLLAGLILSPLTLMATDPIRIFTGPVIYFPGYSGNTVPSIQVDATIFSNAAPWTIGTVKPYTTDHTLNYINEGSMWGTVGWEFDYGPLPPPGGGRGMSSSFFNDYGATIQAADSSIPNPYSLGSFAGYPVSHLWVNATNIVNNGTLIGGGAGEIQLTGVNVDLFYGTLEISSFARGDSSYNSTNFSSSTAIYDEYWGLTNTFPNSTTPYAMDSSTIWNGTTARSPTNWVNTTCGVLNVGTRMAFNPVLADSISTTNLPLTNIIYTNVTLTTVTSSLPVEIFRQAVFVARNDANITLADSFLSSGNPTNLFEAATVRLFNLASGDTLYLVDTLASLTNRGLLLNLSTVPGSDPTTPCADPTFRPANYILSGTDPRDSFNRQYFADGSSGAGWPASNFLYDVNYTNASAQATYASYSAYVDDLTYRQSGSTVTNWPGRIIIEATNLDLSLTIISNKGAEITIHSSDLIDSTGAVVSCRNLSYNLGSVVGNLNVTNLASALLVTGLFNGSNNAFSALWTNGYYTVMANYEGSNWTVITTNITGCPLACATNFTTNAYSATNLASLITNTTIVNLHVLLVDARGLSTTEPETVQDLILHSTNMLVSDSMNVVSTLLFDGQNLTLLGNLTLSGSLPNWTYVNAPTLRYFTNNGALSIPQDVHFGDDGPMNYAAFVNNGTITVGGRETINSDYYQSGGSENALGGYLVTTSIGKVENASITSSGQSVGFYAGILRLNNSQIWAGRQLNFNVTNSLFDMGGSSGNTLTCNRGFNLPLKPATGDLLGTTINSTITNRSVVDHVWAATNLGPTVAGFSNNVAIGRLVLSSLDPSPPVPPFHFIGAGVSNALYVDYLDLTQLSTGYSNMLRFDPNIVIYYAAATNNYTPPQAGGIDQEWEEYLNGQFGGHLRWVTNFAGPNSSVDVIIGGNSYKVNRALRESKIIDSDGDGTPNYYDSSPFGTVPPTGSIPNVTLKVSLLVNTLITNVLYSYTTNYITNITSIITTNRNGKRITYTTNYISNVTTTVTTNTSESVINSINPAVVQPPTGQSSLMNASAQTEQSSSAILAISWLATANTVYQVEFATNLSLVNWQLLLAYTNNAPTNRTVMVFDTNAPAGAPSRFYRVSHP